jgi:hypothetical protein
MSLLKRIEQGQGTFNNQGGSDGDSRSRLVPLQARRVTAPGASAQKDTYLDLKARVQNRLLA